MTRTLAFASILCCAASRLGFAGTEDPSTSAWSLDGQTLAYVRANAPYELRLAKVADKKSELLLTNESLLRVLSFGGPGGEEGRPRLIAAKKDPNRLILATCHRIVSLNLKTRVARVLLTSEKGISGLEISPDDRWISFLCKEHIELLDLSSGSVRSLTANATTSTTEGSVDAALVREFEMPSAYWWAPDASAIAYLSSERRTGEQLRSGAALPPATLWVCSVRKRDSHPVDLANLENRYIPKVSWFPDSRRLLAEVLNREQTSLSVVVASSRAGQPITRFEETDPYWINTSGVFHLFKDGEHLLWASERTGYRQPNYYDLRRQSNRILTTGTWEIDRLSYVNEEERQVYFTSTISGPTERTLYRVGLEGGTPTRVSQGSGTHIVSFSPTGSVYLDSWSDLMNSPRRSVHQADGTLLFSLDDGQGARFLRCPPQLLTIRTHDGTRLDAMLTRPVSLDPTAKYPVIVEANGEPRKQLVRNAWDGWRTTWRQMMAQHGFVILTVDCRGSGGHGHRFEEPLHYRLGAQELSDLRDTVDWLHRLPYVDRNRIGIWGSSPYNGFLALEAIFMASSQFRVAVANSPILDWNGQSAPFVERYLGLQQTHHEEYEKSSPVEFATRFMGKLLIVNGDASAGLPPGLDSLREKLAKTRGSVEIVEAPSRQDMLARVSEFLLRNL